MPFWYALTLGVRSSATADRAKRISVPVAGLRSGWLMALIIIVTIVLMVPINNRIARLDLDRLPKDWLNMRERWDSTTRPRRAAWADVRSAPARALLT